MAAGNSPRANSMLARLLRATRSSGLAGACPDRGTRPRRTARPSCTRGPAGTRGRGRPRTCSTPAPAPRWPVCPARPPWPARWPGRSGSARPGSAASRRSTAGPTPTPRQHDRQGDALLHRSEVGEEQRQPPERQPAVALERDERQEEQDRVDGDGRRTTRPGAERLLEIVKEQRPVAEEQAEGHDRGGGEETQEAQRDPQGEGVVAPARRGKASREGRQRVADRREDPERPPLEVSRREAQVGIGQVGIEAHGPREGLLGSGTVSLAELLESLGDERQGRTVRGSGRSAPSGSGGSPGRRLVAFWVSPAASAFRNVTQSASKLFPDGRPVGPHVDHLVLGRSALTRRSPTSAATSATATPSVRVTRRFPWRPRRRPCAARTAGPSRTRSSSGGAAPLGLVLQHLQDADEGSRLSKRLGLLDPLRPLPREARRPERRATGGSPRSRRAGPARAALPLPSGPRIVASSSCPAEASSRTTPSGVKCRRSLTVKGFVSSVIPASVRRRRDPSAARAPLRGGECVGTGALPGIRQQEGDPSIRGFGIKDLGEVRTVGSRRLKPRS